MATSSASSISSSSFPKASRFSTLKVFKFASKEARPPPPPPKDNFFSRNRSLISLSPDSPSVPSTPLTPHPQNPYYLSPNMNQSSVSVVSTAASIASYATADGSSQKGPKKTKSGFFKFPKRSPRARSIKSPPPDDVPPLPVPDENISVPFNFQHNIHVDEGYSGLPPSWTMSLAQAGFSEEEIAEIHARRAAGRSQYLFSERPASPAYTATESPITYTNTFSMSLARQASDASRAGTVAEAAQVYPQSLTSPRLGPSPNSPAKSFGPRKASIDSQTSSHPSISSRACSGSVDTHTTNGNRASTVTSATTATSPLSRSIRPSTPPRRTYHVTNDAMNSPPPSYTNFTPNGSYSSDKKDGSLSHPPSTPRTHALSHSVSSTSSFQSPDATPQQTGRTNHPPNGVQPLHERTPSSSSSSSESTRPPILESQADSLRKRLTALPPRLSLHKNTDSTDLSSWGEALFSGISTRSEVTPGSSTFAEAQNAKISSTLTGSGKPLLSPENRPDPAAVPAVSQPGPSQPHKGSRAPPPSRPVPVPPLQNSTLQSTFYRDDEEVETPSSAWAEPASTARYDPLAENWDVPELPSPQSTEGISAIWHSRQRDVRLGQGIPQGATNATRRQNSQEKLLTPPYSVQGIEGRRATSEELEDDNDDGLLRARDEAMQRSANRDSSRSSTSTVLAEPAIVRNVSIARRAGAYVIDHSRVKGGLRQAGQGREHTGSPAFTQSSPPVASSVSDRRHPPSPLSLNFGSEEGSASTSGSSSTLSQQTPVSEADMDSPLTYYLDSSPSPDPSRFSFPLNPNPQLKMSVTDTYGIVQEEIIVQSPEENEIASPASPPLRPKIIISGVNSPGPLTSLTTTSAVTTPGTPFQRYPGWLSSVVAPLEQFIDEAIDPREYYLDLHEIAEGDSGSVFASRLTKINRHKLKVPPLIKARDADDLANDRTTLVAIKSVAILPSGSPKLIDLEKELSLMKGLGYEHVLSMDAVYVDLVEDTLWIRMELMERSLADIIGLVPEGLMLQDRMIARFASDVLLALEFLQKHCIAHRDVRSDNLLLNSQGILKLADFSNAVRVTRESPMLSDAAGVLYWQAPEVRSPPYNALQVDLWSLGATVWEMAEAEPPFAETQQISDRWPPLSKPQLYSPAFHDFLRQCSQPASSRPTPNDLKKTPFINNACGRPVIIQLLSQCMAIEQSLQERETSQGSVLE